MNSKLLNLKVDHRFLEIRKIFLIDPLNYFLYINDHIYLIKFFITKFDGYVVIFIKYF